jgi:hypothetical protein
LLIFGAAGCLEQLPRASLIEELRIVGAQAEPPEVSPGDSVSLRVLIAQPEPTPVDIAWFWCVLPERGSGFAGSDAQQAGFSGGKGYGLDDVGDCSEPEAVAAGFSTALGTGPEVELTVPTDFLSEENTRRAYGLSEDVELDPSVLAGLWSIAGINLTVSVRVTSISGETQSAFKRVNVSTASPPNTNPERLAFRLVAPDAPEEAEESAPSEGEPPVDGSCVINPQPLRPGRWRIEPLNIPDPPVEYTVLVSTTDPDEVFQITTNEETLFYSYFSARGRIGSNVTKSTGKPETDWELTEEDLVGPVPLWIVVRDGRGGTAWCSQTFEVAPD